MTSSCLPPKAMFEEICIKTTAQWYGAGVAGEVFHSSGERCENPPLCCKKQWLALLGIFFFVSNWWCWPVLHSLCAVVPSKHLPVLGFLFLFSFSYTSLQATAGTIRIIFILPAMGITGLMRHWIPDSTWLPSWQERTTSKSYMVYAF